MTKPDKPLRLVLCGGDDCKPGRKKVRRALEHALEQHNLSDQVEIQISKCQDRCKHGPNLTLMPGAFPYSDLTPERAEIIITRHVVGGEPVDALLAQPKKNKKR